MVLTVLGDKWRETAPIVHLLALAMPFMTLQVLFTPASETRGRPKIGVQNGAVGALILTTAFLVGVRWGPTGMGVAWITAYPVYMAISAWRTLPVIGVRAHDVVRAVASPALAAIAMALVVGLIDRTLPPLYAPWRLALLVTIGAVVYATWMLVFARAIIRELISVLRKQPTPA
jgi:O-antigen/teichoic acid export membrane protein